ncbi:DNA-packaging protein [Xenorhabdus griffiniae]|uniref:DNA-packaging protein n=1 Tax=Xenorhabdus griffiniae TaxID=351672 RepID=A0ABY9XEA4_9GAMM|nr:DNA-packaging protein [Xenorhabdus griffiniae]MBD1228372.1 DNA-packaging protein [Xenorhabdus griffiniae]MBE8587975.1 DNA-packaging protein [Xenorhabdus griffiniae]WMV71245.1 DNA-packaging protein [Xenorhabdus griffiniae]WNH00921.1 DNA-packaging protein [Xenorhabdus griffiniae]
MGQQTNQVGCPSKLNDELIAKAKEYLYGGYKEYESSVIPSIAGLACYLGIARSTVYEYAKQDSDLGREFSDTLEGVMAMQELKLINSGLNGEFNPTITKLMMANHGYSEKQEVDHQSSDGSMSQKPTVIRLVGVSPDGADG